MEGLDDALTSHATESGGCGYVKFPPGVVLTCDATGRELTLHLPTTLGQSSLKVLDPSDARFLSPEQFRVDKVPERGGWVLAHIPYATNPTYVNGEPALAEGSLLNTGDSVSIKDKYFRLTVRLLS